MPSTRRLILPFLFIGASAGTILGQSFYDKSPPLFSMRPDEKKSSDLIARFGAVGINIERIHPAFAMKVKDIEPDSPAEAQLSVDGETYCLVGDTLGRALVALKGGKVEPRIHPNVQRAPSPGRRGRPSPRPRKCSTPPSSSRLGRRVRANRPRKK